MSEPVNLASVFIWGSKVGAVLWDSNSAYGVFEYAPEFLDAPVELSPITMAKQAGQFTFWHLPQNTFYGLPGLLADSLPDKFGNALIDRWCVDNGRNMLNPVERLLYIGNRGMGALEYRPVMRQASLPDAELDVGHLVELSNQILNERESFNATLPQTPKGGSVSGLADILQVGTSAGGARAKAVIAWNKNTGEVRSGQVSALPDGFAHYLIKFDGVTHNRDKELLSDPQGFGLLEYTYYRMATAAGITMMPSELYKENGRSHFLTQRFDRVNGDKLHVQTLCGLAHFDYNKPGVYSYEQAFQIIMMLLGAEAQPALEQQYRRMVFNVIARNQDDHTKNISFLMDRKGKWSLSPAYDVTYSFNPDGEWTSGHQMTIAGKRGIAGRDPLTLDDLLMAGKAANIKEGKARVIIKEVVEVVAEFERVASDVGVDERMIQKTKAGLRLTY